MSNMYDKFLGGWVGAVFGSALGRFTEGHSPQWIEDRYPTGLRRLPESGKPAESASLAFDTSTALSLRREFELVASSVRSPYATLLRVLPVGLASGVAEQPHAEVERLALEAMAQAEPPFRAVDVLGALLYARVLRDAIAGVAAGEEIDACLFGPVEQIERPSPELVKVGGDESQVSAWGEARILVTEGIGAGLNSLERYDFMDPAVDAGSLAVAVVAWAVLTELPIDKAFEYLVSRGGRAGDLGMIGGAILGVRIGFKNLPRGLLAGLDDLDGIVEAGAKLYRAAEEYKR